MSLIFLTQDASNQKKHIHVIPIQIVMFCQIWGPHSGCRWSTSSRVWCCVNGEVVPNTSKDPTAFQILGTLCPLTQKHIPEDHVWLVRSQTLFFIYRLFSDGNSGLPVAILTNKTDFTTCSYTECLKHLEL